MNLTKHAIKRADQRGINIIFLNILLYLGYAHTAPGNTSLIEFGSRKERLKIAKQLRIFANKLEKERSHYLILSQENEKILTCGILTKRIKKS